jgi:hypothetical protein
MIFTANRENPKYSLRCFDEFEPDINLPRWAALNPTVTGEDDPDSYISAGSRTFPVMVSRNPWVGPRLSGFGLLQALVVRPIGRLRSWWRRRRAMSPQGQSRLRIFFELLLTDPNLVLEFDAREEATERALESAQQAGQRELVRQLTQHREIQRTQNAMLTVGITKAITEEQLLQYARLTDAGLHLDWISRFTRPIPAEVLARKAECDKLCLFDNYVVLYIDFNNEMQRKVEADRARQRATEVARDPILFGVLEGSRKLYFVADWIDEFCDLTLDQIIRRLNNPLDMEDPKP